VDVDAEEIEEGRRRDHGDHFPSRDRILPRVRWRQLTYAE
jgi:hypothetical protein